MSDPIASAPKNLLGTVMIALDEAFKALEESLSGLSNDQVWSHPIERRHCVAVILLHVQENIDRHACCFQVGQLALAHDERFAIGGRPVEDFTNVKNGPHVDKLRSRTRLLRDAVFATLEGVTDRELFSPRHGEQTYWWQQHRRVSVDAYQRVIWHTNAHIRQIWCLRGAMGAVGPDHFPSQFWH